MTNDYPFHHILFKVYGTNHDIEHGVTILKAKLLHDVVTGDDWIPTNDPPAPSRPLKSWLNDVNAIRKETASLYNYYTDLKPGCGDAPPFWLRPVPVKFLVEGKQILKKAGNMKEKIAAEDIVGWSDMMNVQLAKGPKKEKIKFDIGWKSSLVVLYETFLAHKKISSTDHHSKRKSSVDFISPTPNNKRLKPIEILRQETIKNKERSLSFSSSDERDEDFLPTPKKALTHAKNLPKAPTLKSSLLKPAPRKSHPRSSSSSSRTLVTKKKAQKKSKPSKKGDIGFMSSSESEEDRNSDFEVYTQKTPEKETDPVLVDLEEKGHDDLQPILHDWVDIGRLYGSLSDWSPDCLLQLHSVDIINEKIVLTLRDAETSICASVNPKYNSQKQYLNEGCVIKLVMSSGPPEKLVIVSNLFPHVAMKIQQK